MKAANAFTSCKNPNDQKEDQGGNAQPVGCFASNYAQELADRIPDVPVILIDERLSTVTAASHLREGGIDSRKQRPVIDQAALARRNVRVVGGPMAQHLQGRVAQASAEVFDAYRRGVFGDFKATAYPLVQAAQAHEDIAARRKTGPMILVP